MAMDMEKQPKMSDFKEGLKRVQELNGVDKRNQSRLTAKFETSINGKNS